MTNYSSAVSTPVNGKRWRLKEKKRVRKTACKREHRQELEEKVKKKVCARE
jgi:hypothetical protein